MKHRERVEAALDHRVPDRCPLQISFTPEFAKILRRDLEDRGTLAPTNLQGVEHNPHGGGNTYELERVLNSDMLLTSVGWANSYYRDHDDYTDDWGIKWHSVYYETKFGAGRYTEICGHPLAENGAIDNYVPPDPSRPELYEEAEKTILQYGPEYWIVGVTVTTIFECAWALRGLQQLLMDFVLNPELTNRILDIPYLYHLQAAKKLVELGVDMIWIGDDVGAQQGMVISPDHWRVFLKPRLAALIAVLREMNPRLKIAYHSDGNIYDIIPDLIEIGIDVLNPIQPACMNPSQLKDQFGDQLCFWGSIDEQHTLPFAKADDVRNEVLSRIRTLGKGGGLIIGPTHHVQLDTPLENFWSMMDAILYTPYEDV
jgi:uroporphyrinogen decarboxylase